MKDDLSGAQIVTIAAYLLGGQDTILDTEDIAMKAAELAPGRFSWKKYPNQVNLELVRVFLSDAKKGGRNRQLLIGSGAKGWSLTPAGAQFAKQETPTTNSAEQHSQSTRRPRSKSPTGDRLAREESRLVALSAFKLWRSGQLDQISKADVWEVFRIDSYTDRRLLLMKVNRLQATVESIPELDSFVQDMSRRIDLEGE